MAVAAAAAAGGQATDEPCSRPKRSCDPSPSSVQDTAAAVAAAHPPPTLLWLATCRTQSTPAAVRSSRALSCCAAVSQHLQEQKTTHKGDLLRIAEMCSRVQVPHMSRSFGEVLRDSRAYTKVIAIMRARHGQQADPCSGQDPRPRYAPPTFRGLWGNGQLSHAAAAAGAVRQQGVDAAAYIRMQPPPADPADKKAEFSLPC